MIARAVDRADKVCTEFPARLAHPTDASAGIAALRLPLTALECERLRKLGAITAHAVEATARHIEPGQTEADIAGQLAPALTQPVAKPKFPASLTLSLDDAAAISSSRYATVVGILGLPDAGKTAAIASLYLLLASNKLAGYEIRDTQTLMALEQISRGARRWNESNPPPQMTVHTELPDERPAGFIHFCIERTVDNAVLDLLLPDLPGEWSETLIDKNRIDRLAFLKGADAIWLMIDGAMMGADETRVHATHRTSMMLERTAALLGANHPPVTIVVTRRDKGQLDEALFAGLFDEAKQLGIKLNVMQIASFSEDADMKPGEGLSELVNSLLVKKSEDPIFWPERSLPPSDRKILGFKGIDS